jgi:hypothetical protein
MIALLRLLVLAFLGLTVVRFVLAIYFRSLRREALEKDWDSGETPGRDGLSREDYVARGMAQYESGLKRRLLWLVYIIPMVAIVVIAYVQNHQ